jgi:hypothetical protein
VPNVIFSMLVESVRIFGKGIMTTAMRSSFCWKPGEDPDKPSLHEDDSSKDGTSDSESIYKKQQKMLHDVRKAIPDDVPFWIFGHIFGNATSKVVANMYSTELLLPYYHNPMTGLCCGSVKPGAGEQTAIEWLIPCQVGNVRCQMSYFQGPKLLQSSSEELYVKPNAKMLSLKKIRPTSKCGINLIWMYVAMSLFWTSGAFD